MSNIKERLYLLDILRGIAAYFVVIFHYGFFKHASNSEIFYVNNQLPFYNILFSAYEDGWIAVQFFYILSGFIFYYLYLNEINNKKISFKKFLILRFSRLYPLHFVTLNFILILYFIYKINDLNQLQFSEINAKHYLLNILLISNWGFENRASFNTPSGSISIEVLLYILFFFIARKKIQIFYSTIFLVLLSIFIFFFNKLIGYGIFCFFIGGLTYLITKKIDNLEIKNNIIVNFFLLICCLVLFLIYKYKIEGVNFKILFLTIFFPSLIIALYFTQKIESSLGKKISIIGDISYSVYLIHFVINIIILGVLELNNFKFDITSKFYFLSYIFIITIISLFSHFYFEKPTQKFFRKNI